MKNNLGMRPAKYLVAAVMKLNPDDVQDVTTKDFEPTNNGTQIKVHTREWFQNDYTLTHKILYDDFAKFRMRH